LWKLVNSVTWSSIKPVSSVEQFLLEITRNEIE